MISDLKLHHFRCFPFYHLSLNKNVSFFYGANGKGKTSILEAVNQVLTGRSFRTNHTKELVQFDYQQFTVTADFSEGYKVGLQKSRNGQSRKLKINGSFVSSLTELVELFPSRVITPVSYKQILTPSARRNWIDWLVFHVEHSSKKHYIAAAKILKQRNALLKSSSFKSGYSSQFEAWDAELIKHWLLIDGLRQQYLSELLLNINQLLSSYEIPELHFNYKVGWGEQVNDTASLSKDLRASFDRDLRSDFTNRGINKADLKIKVYNTDAHDILSRGQLKILVHVINYALINMYQKYNQKKPYLILDDALEEIDDSNQNKLLSILASTNYEQLMFSSVAPYKQLENLFDVEMFHVEHSV